MPDGSCLLVTVPETLVRKIDPADGTTNDNLQHSVGRAEGCGVEGEGQMVDSRGRTLRFGEGDEVIANVGASK